MKIVLFYFSGTGNTWWITRQYEELLKQKGCELEVFSIENEKLKQPGFIKSLFNQADKIILGYPVYASAMPRNMHDFILDFPVVKNKPLIVFCTQAAGSGDGAIYFKHQYQKKGFIIEQALHICMGSNFYIPAMPFFKPPTEKKLEQIKTKALRKIEKSVTNLINNKKYIQGQNLPGHCLGGLQRKYDYMMEDYLIKNLYINPDLCINCQKCIKNCPVGNIVAEEGGYVFKNDCIFCLRCYNFCPVNAVNISQKTEDGKKFIRYKGPEKEISLTEIRL